MAMYTPQQEYGCDGTGCNESIKIDMEIRYRNYGDDDGFYCWRETTKTLINDWGWTEDEQCDEYHYCDACSKSEVA
jgi:hypothetical protein